MGYYGRGKMIRFEIPVLDAFLLSDALKCATNRHKIKDYADVIRIMNYRKFFESEARKHSEEPPAPPKSDTTLTTKESFLEELKKQGVPLEVHKQVMWERDIAIDQLREIGKSLGEKMDDIAEAIKNNSDYIKKQDLLKELEQDFSDEQIEKVIDTINNIQEKYIVENKMLVDQNII